MPSKVHGPASLRFWSKVRRTDSCWEWTGHIEPRTGYGKIKCRIPGDSQRKVHLTHRGSFATAEEAHRAAMAFEVPK